MKKPTSFNINSIFECGYLLFRMPEKIRNHQLKLREQMDALQVPVDNSELLFESTLPVISHDEMWATLSISEKALAESFEYGSIQESAESYDLSKLNNSVVDKKT